jgi:hypothetical protein
MTEKTFIQIDDEVIEAKGEVLAYIDSWKSDLNQTIQEQLLIQKAKEASRKSAIEKLTTLGLTEQEVLDLLGITVDAPEAE